MNDTDLDSPTREHLLASASALMLGRGFAATAIDDVCANAKLTKGAFFHHFESKEDLGRVLIERWAARRKTDHAKMFGADADPLVRLFRYADSLAAAADSGTLLKGCLLGSFALELSTVPPIRKACERGFAEWTEQLSHEIALAKERHAPRASLSPIQSAEQFIAVIEGAVMMSKASGDGGIVRRAADRFKTELTLALKG
ncbi:MAG: TetR/AcrR family transcriptional regulator [Elusimicrobiota bacterium]